LQYRILQFEEGSVIEGRYRLEQLIGQGGMGLVYLATHTQLNKKVALKIMLPQFIEFKEQITRFLNEAVGIANIHHRNIVDIIDAGLIDKTIPFFVMEFLRGETLKDRMRRKEKMKPPEIGRIMAQTLMGLSALHSRKIIHRDTKPSNIFISTEEDGTEVVKILDFGVSKFHFQEVEQIAELTTTGTILGTPTYMSPEQARGRKGEVDHRTDIYSCGVVLYRSLTGLNPFQGDAYSEVILNILQAEVPPPSFLAPELSPAIDEVVLKAMARDKERRFQDCQSFIDAMGPFVEGEDSSVRKALLSDGISTSGKFRDFEISVGKGASGVSWKKRYFSRRMVLATAALIVGLAVFIPLLMRYAAGLEGSPPGAGGKPGGYDRTETKDQEGNRTSPALPADAHDEPAAAALDGMHDPMDDPTNAAPETKMADVPEEEPGPLPPEAGKAKGKKGVKEKKGEGIFDDYHEIKEDKNIFTDFPKKKNK
jgi:serine/threonine protein kinase